MKFLVDAQLPRQLALWLSTQNHDALHTLDLPAKNKTPDDMIRVISLEEARIVISKDVGFVDSFTLSGQPPKLLLVTTGNISNRALLTLFKQNLATITLGFETFDYIELSHSMVIYHT